MTDLLFIWIAVLIQSSMATPEQVHSIHQAWAPSCAQQGGELQLTGASRIWNGQDAFVIEGRCERGNIAPARNNA